MALDFAKVLPRFHEVPPSLAWDPIVKNWSFLDRATDCLGLTVGGRVLLAVGNAKILLLPHLPLPFGINVNGV